MLKNERLCHQQFRLQLHWCPETENLRLFGHWRQIDYVRQSIRAQITSWSGIKNDKFELIDFLDVTTLVLVLHSNSGIENFRVLAKKV